MTSYYHGSSISLPVGTILVPQPDYEQRWAHTDFYACLERYRPPAMLAHKHAVFMCMSDEDIDLAGGATEYLFRVKPLGRIQKHDLNWSSEISMLISDGLAQDSAEIRQAAVNYWAGIPHPNESVWEILTESAEVLFVEEY